MNYYYYIIKTAGLHFRRYLSTRKKILLSSLVTQHFWHLFYCLYWKETCFLSCCHSVYTKQRTWKMDFKLSFSNAAIFSYSFVMLNHSSEYFNIFLSFLGLFILIRRKNNMNKILEYFYSTKKQRIDISV